MKGTLKEESIVELVLRYGKHEAKVDLNTSTKPEETLRRIRLRGGGGAPRKEAAFQLAQELRHCTGEVLQNLAATLVSQVDTPLEEP